MCENRCVYYDQSEFWCSAMGGCLKSGGDVCIATGGTKACFSIFVSDSVPVLICLGAEVEAIDGKGRRWLPVEQLYNSDGLRPHTLPPDALLTHIRIPLAEEGSMFFRKIRPRASVDFTNLTLAVRMSMDDSSAETYAGQQRITLAMSGVGPAPVWIRDSTSVEADALTTELMSRTQIVDNVAYQRAYRKGMLRALVKEGIQALMA